MGARIKGLSQAIKGLQGAERSYREGLTRRANQILAPVRRAAARYPSKRRGQVYQRTFALKRGWTQGIPNVRSLPGLVQINLANTVDYAPDVQEAGEQDPMFVGRWPTLDQIGLAQELAVAAEVDATLEKVKVF